MPYWESIQALESTYYISNFFEKDSPNASIDEHVPTKSISPAAHLSLTEPRPRILVCHDMMGGYTEEDHLPHGNRKLSHVFTIHFWQFIDIFVYFSHKRITVPPVQWTMLAHQHGSLCLGTLIFEWDESIPDLYYFMYGESPKDKPVLSYKGCDKLVQLALYYRFDGWLLNIETELPGGTAQAEDLCLLVGYLEKELKIYNLYSKVIWYDACTIEGKLKWQDKLTPLNRPFFNVCSGIFTNYTWKETYPKDSFQMSPERAYDIYTGIDVFGRNTYGGGQFNVNVALNAALNAGTSVALFAPAWIYECHEKAGFLILEHQLWNSFLHETLLGKPMYPDARHMFSTYFTTGYGSRFFLKGELVSEKPWSNHALQSVITVLHQPGCKLSFDTVYFGSTSLMVEKEIVFEFTPNDVSMTTGLMVFKGSTSFLVNEKKYVAEQIGTQGWLVCYLPFAPRLSLKFNSPVHLGQLCFSATIPDLPTSIDFDTKDGFIIRKDLDFLDIPCEVYINDRFEAIHVVPRFPLPETSKDESVFLKYHKHWIL